MGGVPEYYSNLSCPSRAYPHQLPYAQIIRQAVKTLIPKSRMREIRTYGSVVGPISDTRV